ncbi:MAG: hypothetical protein ACXU82_14710 [Caulobacteraceae bacterium]
MSNWPLSAGLLPRIVALALGCILLSLMAKSLRTGATQLVHRDIRRRDDPVLYWTGIAIAAIGGVVLVLVAVFPQLQRL